MVVCVGLGPCKVYGIDGLEMFSKSEMAKRVLGVVICSGSPS